MAVYERTYRSYAGRLTPVKTRFLVLPRYAYREVIRSRLFIAFLVGCGLWPFLLTIFIYLPHNSALIKNLEKMGADPDTVLSIFNYDAEWFFDWFFTPYAFVAVVVALIVGPALISADLRNNGLPLYLARPFSRSEYVMGKAAVLVFLLSAVSWVPGLFLFLFQSYLEGWVWFLKNLRIGLAMVLAFGIWIAILCLVALAVSAYLKWKPVARATFLAIFIVAGPLFGNLINFMFDTGWGSIVDLVTMMRVASSGIFGVEGPGGVPTWAAWASLLVACTFFLAVLSRRLRAYEVVR